jgi:hypothetical protein
MYTDDNIITISTCLLENAVVTTVEHIPRPRQIHDFAALNVQEMV